MTDINSDRYRGPRYFEDTPEDRRVFFGRSEETESVAQQVLASRLLVLFGKSGLGKTSLLLAGLFPRLRAENYLPIRIRLSSSESPLDLVVETARSVSAQWGIDFVPGEGGNLWEFFKTAMFWREGALLTPVLVFDQFEELFTLGSPSLRKAFAREVGPLVSGNAPETLRGRLRESPPDVKIVLSFREEYLGALQELSGEIPGLFQERFRLQPFSEGQAREAIQNPALLDGASASGQEAAFTTPPFTYDEQALSEMIAFLKGRSQTIEPFQLQLLCQHIEQAIVKPLALAKNGSAESDPIRVTAAELGGRSAMAAILERFYTGCLAALPRTQRKRARELCESGLLTPAGHRLMLQEDQIRREYKVDRKTLEYLLEKRLLHEEPRLESLFYELSHDTLAQSILRVRRWRIPKRWRPALALAGAAAALVVILTGVFILRLDTERRSANSARDHAENLVSFLIGEDLLQRVRLMGRLDFMSQVQDAIERNLPSLQELNASDLARRNRALALLNEGDVLREKFQVSKAKEKYQSARAIFDQLSRRNPANPDWRRDYAKATEKLGEIAMDQLRLSDELDLRREALAIRNRLLQEKTPDEDRLLRDIVDNHSDIGTIFLKRHRMTESIAEFDEALRIAGSRCNLQSESAEWLRICQDAHQGRGVVLMLMKDRRDDSGKALQSALDYAERGEKRTPFDPEAQYRVGLAANKLGNLKTYQDPKQALPLYERLYAAVKPVADADPNNAKFQRETAATIILLGEGRALRGDNDGALKQYDTAQQQLEKLRKIDESNASLADDLVWVHRSTIDALNNSKRFREAAAECDRTLSILEPLAGLDKTNIDIQVELVSLLIRKGIALRGQEKFDAALESFARAASLIASGTPIDPTDSDVKQAVDWLNQEAPIAFHEKADAEIETGKKLEDRKDYAGALAAYESADQVLEQANSFNPGWPSAERNGGFGDWWDQRLSLIRDYKAPLLQKMGAPLKALEAYRQALAFAAKSASLVGRDDITPIYLAMGRIQRSGEPFQALASLRRYGKELRDASKLDEAILLYYNDIEPLCKAQNGAAFEAPCREALAESPISPDPAKDNDPRAVGKAHQQVGESFEKAGDALRAFASYAIAEQEFRRAIARNPENSDLWYDLASLFYLDVAPLRTKGGNPAGALQAYQEALAGVAKAAAMEPNNAAHHSDLSLAHQRVGAFLEEQGRQTEASEEYRQAVAAAQEAVQLDSKSGSFHYTLATARQHQGDGFLAGNHLSPAIVEYRLAELEFRDAIRLDGNSADRWSELCLLLREHLAPARKKSGDQAAERQALTDALAAIQQAIILAPNEAGYRKTRDELQTALRAPGSN
ncbi:MAG TPA: hypothetical protein VIY49_22065 [Bryobacteraceae bacterium]